MVDHLNTSGQWDAPKQTSPTECHMTITKPAIGELDYFNILSKIVVSFSFHSFYAFDLSGSAEAYLTNLVPMTRAGEQFQLQIFFDK